MGSVFCVGIVVGRWLAAAEERLKIITLSPAIAGALP